MRAHVFVIDENNFGFKKKCFHCSEETMYSIAYKEYVRLFVNKEYVEDVFPNLNKEERELMISGTHSKCWKEMFGECDD